MSDLPTQNDYFRIGRDEILIRSEALTKEVVERRGTDANAMVGAGSGMADEVTGQLARVQASLFMDSAKGKNLDRLLIDRYGLYRKPAAPAYVTLEFTLPTANPAAFNIPQDTAVQTGDGNQFLTLNSVVFPMGSTGPIEVYARSAQAGLTQQAQADTITVLLGLPAGAPDTLAVTNPVASFGADNEEEDEAYRARGREFFVTARRGTLRAIKAGALAFPGVRTATAFEYLDQLGRPSKGVSLVIADAFTEQLVGVTPTPAAYQTQSAALCTAVVASLDDVRAAGILVSAQVAEVVLMGATLALSFRAGVDVDEVTMRARATVAAYINSLSPGASFVWATAQMHLRAVAGLLYTGNEIYSPAGDVVPSALQVLRAPLGMITAVPQGIAT